MNRLKIPSLNNTQKLIFMLVFIFAVIIIFSLLFKSAQTKSSIFTNTIPVIPTTTTRQETSNTTLDTVRVLNPKQKISFNWGSISPSVPNSMSVYDVNIPLINNTTTTRIIDKLGFTSKDLQQGSNGDLQLINNTSSLFISPNTNQISYFSTQNLPKHITNVSPVEAGKTAIDTLTNLFGDTFASTLDKNPEINYLIHLPTDVEIPPREASMETGNVILVSFKQYVNGFPIVSKSQKGETVSVAIDTTNKLYSLFVSGGYQKISEIKKNPLINFATLRENAPQNSLRISYAKDMGSESGYTDAKQINVTVKSIELGYFQLGYGSLSPIFIINGIMSATGLADYPAIYIVPASAE